MVQKMLGQMVVAVDVLLMTTLVWYAHKTFFKPPPPKICGTPDGPPVTSKRIILRDGRHLAYKEYGVPKEKAKYKIIHTHGFNGSKEWSIPVSEELINELKLYFLHFDRAGYGDSDPYPKRTVKSEAFDVEDLADALQLGPKFYVLSGSMGGYAGWSCIKYIPHRLAGVSLVAPFVHYWWSGFPADLYKKAFQRLPSVWDQWTFRVAHYAPRLFYWWMTQRNFVPLSFDTLGFTQSDLNILRNRPPSSNREKITQQGVHESLHRDIMTGYADWGFSPLDLDNPFTDGQGSVQIWQGYEDRIIQFEINRHIQERLPWIKYHEIRHGGHLFLEEPGMADIIIRALVLNI